MGTKADSLYYIQTQTTYTYIRLKKTVMPYFWFQNMLSHYRSCFFSLSKAWYKGHRIFLTFLSFFLFLPSSLTNQNSMAPLKNHVKYLPTNDPLPNNWNLTCPPLLDILYLYYYLAKSSTMLDFLGQHSKNPLHKMKSSPPCMARV